ncbi:ABC transporter ATP-binding protein [Methanosphaerula subterraneus]|uniref:ABC transporter ATP-binding protein n=1 Tax=Methanosphaerula subterraneus TaxID=3350244 RepID=UPI003F87E352
MLEIHHLHARVGDREILHDVTFTIGTGETHALLGPNGSGKTTLLMAIMGFGNVEVTGGSIIYNGEDITSRPLRDRAQMGIGMMFQRPPTIAGLKLGKLLDVTSNHRMDQVHEYAQKLNMEPLLDRDINKGFSGGEIKRSEVLQLMVQQPDLLLLDEPESGVDIENMAVMGNALSHLLEKDSHIPRRKKSGLIITHTGYILDYLDVDAGHVLIDGMIRCHGNPREILKVVKKSGYRECIECEQI